MRLGVDFGTTNSAIAYYDGSALRMVRVDPLNDNPYILPSLLYIDRKGEALVGAGAAARFLEQEIGRPFIWRRREAGEIRITVASFTGSAPIEFSQDVYTMIDEGANGRLMQSIKRGLFNERYEGTQVFGTYYRIEDLIALVLGALKRAAERERGIACPAIVLGRPVRFADNPLADSRAEAILLKAAYRAGFEDIIFQAEPVGVAYLYHQQARQRQTALVFDFGGGTLDLTVAAVGGGDPPQILATAGAAVGGDDLDRRIMEALLGHFGGGPDGRLPPDMINRLLDWQTIPELSQPYNIAQIRQIMRDADDPRPYRALETLVTRNVAYSLFKRIEAAKQALSNAESVRLEFSFEDIRIHERIARRRFERWIQQEVEQVAASIDSALDGIGADQIDVVLRTGGSSQVPAFYHLLTRRFGADAVQEIDPLISVTGGFAVYAHEAQSRPVHPAGRVIESVSAASGRAYRLGQARLDARPFTDRDFAISRLAARLDGLPLVATANLDYDATDGDFLRLRLREPARVFVAYEATARRLPGWLTRFDPEPLWLEIEDSFAFISRRMQLYSRWYPAGEVVLGGAQAGGYDGDIIVNYLILVEPSG